MEGSGKGEFSCLTIYSMHAYYIYTYQNLNQIRKPYAYHKTLGSDRSARLGYLEGTEQSEDELMKKIASKKVTRFDGPDPSPGFLLWKVSTQWRWEVETALATIGLTYQQFILLASLGWTTRNNADITQIKLARHCGTDITMTSQVLRSL